MSTNKNAAATKAYYIKKEREPTSVIRLPNHDSFPELSPEEQARINANISKRLEQIRKMRDEYFTKKKLRSEQSEPEH